MKISKKIFAILLAVILAFSVMAVGASAAGTATGDEWMTVTITTDKGADTYETEETVTVTVSIACNYNVPTFRFPILYDKTVMETPTLIGLAAENTCASAGTIGSNKFTDGSYVPENYDADQYGVVLVQWVGSVQNGTVGCINNSEGEVAFSFKLKTLASASGKTGTIFIPAESDALYYQAMEDTTIATSIYYMDAESCTMTFNPANVSVAAADVALIPNEAYSSNAVVDEENLVVYGFNKGIASAAEVKTFVAATGNATIRVAAADSGYGTGSKIELQVGGETVKTYTMIIFGDADGDADITSNDLSLLAAYYGGGAVVPNTAILLALDIGIPQDADLNATDLAREATVYGGSVVLDQANPYVAD